MYITVTSVWYLLLLVVGMIVYYTVPRKTQWLILFFMSLCFYYFATDIKSIISPLFSAFVAYLGTWLFENKKISGSRGLKNSVFICSIILIIIPWLLTNGSSFLVATTSLLNKVFSVVPVYSKISILAAIGMAYYTSQLISYVIDCYWGNIGRIKNPLKIMTYTLFFPQLVTGPISRYEDLKSIYEGHSFKYENLCFGAQRILWGFFKKLVVADRVGLIVYGIWGDLETFTGIYRWIALLLYPILIYSDFSGCMDIVLGAAELFDIHLAENFRNPFFSKSIREFWSRWHITLGKWAKDYVMYPILKTPWMVKFTKNSKKKFGKHMGKFISSAFASGMVWLVMGIWHGGVKDIVGVSLYYWILIELGEFFDPIWEGLFERIRFKTNTFSWRLFQSVRTYLVYCFGAVFFQASSVREALSFIKSCFEAIDKENFNPWILFDGSIISTGITYGGMNLIVIGVILLLAVAILREKYGYARCWIKEQGIIFRWIIWISLFVVILICGAYGPTYDASKFIYQGF